MDDLFIKKRFNIWSDLIDYETTWLAKLSEIFSYFFLILKWELEHSGHKCTTDQSSMKKERKKTNISFEQWNSIFLIAKKTKKLRKNLFALFQKSKKLWNNNHFILYHNEVQIMGHTREKNCFSFTLRRKRGVKTINCVCYKSYSINRFRLINFVKIIIFKSRLFFVVKLIRFLWYLHEVLLKVSHIRSVSAYNFVQNELEIRSDETITISFKSISRQYRRTSTNWGLKL